MAYRRRQGIERSERSALGGDTASYPESLAAQAIRASSHSSAKHHGGPTYDYTSMGSTNEASGFWGVLARKAKSILEENEDNEHASRSTPDDHGKLDNPTIRKKLDALTSSMNRIGDSIGNAIEEGRSIVENKTQDIIQETKLQLRRKGIIEEQSTQSQSQTSQEDMLKASRDVAMATAAKAKLLLRELKTVKADLAFAKQRCSQLEEENRVLRDAREKGVNQEEDDLIRLQLETLVAEKSRLAHENSVYARENLFLREIVEYHQLTMQDVVYLDEDIEEVTEVYPISAAVSRTLSASSPSSPMSPRSDISLSRNPSAAKEIPRLSLPPRENKTELSKQ